MTDNKSLEPCQEDVRKDNRHKWMIRALIAVIVILILLLLLRSCAGSKLNTGDAKEGSITISQNEPQDPGAFIVFVNSNIYVRDNIANILAQNDIENSNDCYVTLALEDGTQLYRTSNIQPGEYVDEVELDVNLDPGKYEALAVFHVLSSDGNEITSIAVKSTVTVE